MSSLTCHAGSFARVLAAAIIAGSLSVVYAHGDEHAAKEHGGHGSHSEGSHGHMGTQSSEEWATDSYYLWPEEQFLLWAHIGTMVVAWMFVLPVAVMFCITKSRLYLPVHFLFLALVALGVVFSTIYNASTPDLYPNNSHRKMGWALVAILGVQMVLGILRLGMGEKVRYKLMSQNDEMLLAGASNGQRSPGADSRSTRSSSSTLHDTVEQVYFVGEEEWERDDSTSEGATFTEKLQRNLLSKVPALKSNKAGIVFTFLHEAINRFLIILGFVQICMGVVTATGIFKGEAVFNGLAHFIKGGIFFLYGVITLGRWLGAFQEWGWAWNIKPSTGWKKAPSAELVESSVIFVYGCTNVFLERLAGKGKPWSHGDLQHVSIAILFFGGGLCGILVESKSLRRLLNNVRSGEGYFQPKYLASEEKEASDEQDSKSTASYNPMPALVIFLLGILMGSHHQASELSSTVHKQWGLFLSGFAVTRLATYMLFYISPVKSHLPSRPPTELIGSFCLMVGGLVFMSSNKDTIAGMERRGLDAMFTLTVTAGFTAFLMSWIVVVMVLKSWSQRKKMSRAIASKFVVEDEES